MNEIHALSGAYAVDALDELERARFERHLSECAECRAEVSSLREGASLLSETVPSTPSDALRSRVLADIKTVRPLPPATARVSKVARRRFPGLLVAAVTALVVGGGVVTIHPWTNNTAGTQQVSLADRVLSASDATRHEVAVAGGTATLVSSAKLGRTVVITKGMANPPSGKAYEMWLQDKSLNMRPAGLLPAGNTTQLLRGDSAHAIGAGITIEPETGSEQPTSKTIALVSFASA